jgi:hypothetical protein
MGFQGMEIKMTGVEIKELNARRLKTKKGGNLAFHCLCPFLDVLCLESFA